MTSVTIQPVAGVEELAVCAQLMASSEPWITLRRDAAHALQLLGSLGMDVCVARVDGKFAGLIAVNMQGPFAGYIQVAAVAPEARGQGIGAKLVAFAEHRIFRDSMNVFLCVSDFNPRAQEFYRRLGYERIGELKNYVIQGASEILMRKTMGPKSEFAKTV